MLFELSFLMIIKKDENKIGIKTYFVLYLNSFGDWHKLF